MNEPTLVLIHGLGATHGVWHDLQAELDWSGRIVAPDLPGHGTSAWSGDYTVGALAAAVSLELEADEPVVIAGHSLGGGVALALASQFFRPRVLGVVAVGVKVAWSDSDVETMAGIAAKGVRWVDTRDEAVGRYLRNAGLIGLVDADHPAVDGAVIEGDGGWRVTQDPATFAQKKLDAAGLLAAAQCPVLLGAGADDAMCTEADLAAFTDDARIAADAGHNVQLQRVDWMIDRIAEVTP